ncbi:MAG: sigma-70 family RNA polymerase sigma factor [Planctomycetaceae bacterium]|nr:sigma-70 family RNA polymerase sigma factor [Planctomycetaceae bacterium]
MSREEESLQKLIALARGGDRSALGELCDRHRPFLRLLARRALDTQLQGRVAESDIVQQTMLSAVRNFGQFDGDRPGQFVAWLQVQHERNVVDAARAQRAGKRDVSREKNISTFEPAARSRTSPSRRAMLGEEIAQLAAAMDALPDDQREAVRRRHLEGQTLSDIAEAMGRSNVAVAGLIKRGMATLRDCVRHDSGD